MATIIDRDRIRTEHVLTARTHRDSADSSLLRDREQSRFAAHSSSTAPSRTLDLEGRARDARATSPSARHRNRDRLRDHFQGASGESIASARISGAGKYVETGIMQSTSLIGQRFATRRV
jgi:hypothetical protein